MKIIVKVRSCGTERKECSCGKFLDGCNCVMPHSRVFVLVQCSHESPLTERIKMLRAKGFTLRKIAGMVSLKAVSNVHWHLNKNIK